MPSPISMAKIETLIEDIHKLLGPEDSNLNEDLVSSQVGIFTQHVGQQVKDFLAEKPTYLYGHILEELLILLTILSGHKVTETQKEIHVEGIKGHQDCKIDDVLVDCKSTSHIGFDKFKKGTLQDDVPFGYIEQISAYAEGNDVDEAAFLVINKQTGEICLTPVHSMEMINAGDKIKYLKKIMEVDTPPNKCYDDVPDGVSGNRKLAFGCLYCNHKKLCWQDANQGQGLRVFQYAQSKRYLTNVSRTPDVPEVLNW